MAHRKHNVARKRQDELERQRRERQNRQVGAKISYKAVESVSSPNVIKLVEEGINAMRSGNYNAAEATFQKALEEEPDNCKVLYNLCTVWIRRDGHRGERRARLQLEQLHHDFPDYPFAAIAVAQFAAMDGKLQEARDLLAPILKAKNLHVSEAMSLFTAQVQISLEEGDFESAHRSLEMLRKVAGDDDENVELLRHRIDAASKPRARRGLFS